MHCDINKFFLFSLFSLLPWYSFCVNRLGREAVCFPPHPFLYPVITTSSGVYSPFTHLVHQRIWKGSQKLLFQPFPEPFASFEASILLELFLAKSMFFQYPVSTQHMIPVCSIFIHQVFCDFWIDCKFDIFGFRSTPLCLSLHDRLLINGFVGVPCIHQWLSHLHPLPTHRHVAHTRLGEFLSFQRVVAPLASPALLCQDFRWI
jgi:hypothetical protein